MNEKEAAYDDSTLMAQPSLRVQSLLEQSLEPEFEGLAEPIAFELKKSNQVKPEISLKEV